MAKKRVEAFAGAPRTKGVTKQHRAMIWENMLGTVYGRSRDGEVKYFDYDYEAAHAYAGVAQASDLRVSKCRTAYTNGPRAGRLALYGVYPSTTDKGA